MKMRKARDAIVETSSDHEYFKLRGAWLDGLNFAEGDQRTSAPRSAHVGRQLQTGC